HPPITVTVIPTSLYSNWSIHIVELDRDEMGAGLDERLGQIGTLRRAAVEPAAAVQKDQHRRVRAPGLVDVNLLDLGRPIGNAVGLAEHFEHDLIPLRAPIGYV